MESDKMEYETYSYKQLETTFYEVAMPKYKEYFRKLVEDKKLTKLEAFTKFKNLMKDRKHLILGGHSYDPVTKTYKWVF